MHVFVSDLHLTDGTIGEAVTQEELLKHLIGAIPESAAPVHLVFLGDIFELLRSSKWNDLWKEGGSHVAPWTAMNTDFKGLPQKAKECVLGILGEITGRYRAFSESLKAKSWLQVHYIPGNHDFMVQLIPDARKVVMDFLSLKGVAHSRQFPTVYSDEQAGIYAMHGNKADPLNFHREQLGRWAFGDAIVLRLVNVFIEKTCAHLGHSLAGGSDIAVALQDLDNVEPSEDLAVYFRFLLETHFKNKEQAKEVLEIWRGCVNELLELADFKDKIYKDKYHDLMRTALEFSCRFGLARLAVEVKKKYENLFGSANPDLQAAQDIYNCYPGTYRFIISGHTHRPGLQPLQGTAGHQPYYVNTGCWRRLLTRRHDLVEFRATHVRTRFVVDTDATMLPFYRLVQENETH